MERYRVTGDELRAHYRGGASLRDVFGDIERELKTDRRVVCQYIVNGLAVEEKDESRFAEFRLEQVESLEYLSETTETLLVDVLAGWLQAIPELQKGAENLAARLRAGGTTGVLKSMHDLVENCKFLAGSIQSARTLIGDSAGADLVGSERIEGHVNTALREALRHVESQDFVQLAEVLEYDLNHGLEQWAGLLRNLRARLQNRGETNHVGGTAHSMDRGRGSN